MSAVIDGLFRDATAINERNRQVLERIVSLRLMLDARRHELREAKGSDTTSAD